MSITTLTFALAFLSFAGLAFLRHPIWGLHAYILTFYMGPDTAWWGQDLPNLRWSLMAALITLFAVLKHKQPAGREPWHESKPIRTLMLFVVWLWIQTPWALSTENHLFLSTLFSKYVLMFALVYASLDSKERVHEFLIAHVVGCFWWGFDAWQHHAGGRLENIGTGDAMGSAFASMQVSTGLAIAGFMFMSFKGWKRWVPVLAIPFILNSIVLMQTRGAFMGLLAAVPIALLFGPPAQRTVVVAYLVLGAGLLYYVADPEFWERMGTIKTEEGQEMEASAASRIDLVYANLAMSKDYPMGAGHRGNDLLSPRYMPDWLLTGKDGLRIRSAHNTELAVLVDHGWLGILLIFIFHKRLAQSILQLRKRMGEENDLESLALTAALAVALVMYWINAQFANMIKAEVVIWIAAVTAAMYSLRNR